MQETKLTASNAVSYRGNLSVTLNVKGHKYPFTFHNHGTTNLLKTIVKALSGYSITGCIPRFLDFQQLEDSVYKSVLSNPVPLTGIVYDYSEGSDTTQAEGKLLLNAIITYNDKQHITTLNCPRIVILDSNKQELAIISEGELRQLWSLITESTHALIEWEMVFTTV